jgi:prevent-host-death family protein
MLEMGAYEAKTHLTRLLRRVEKGEQVLILRHRRPVARLVPADGPGEGTVADAIASMREFRKGRRLGAGSLKALIEAGRR